MRRYAIPGAVLLLALLLGYGLSRLYTLDALVGQRTVENAELAARLNEERARTEELSQNLASAIERNDAFTDELETLRSAVGKLIKVNGLDKELLQKYSRVYFLNENYVPSALEEIPDTYLLDPSREVRFHAKALPFLTEMLDAAEDDDIDLRVVSAYRSYGQQANLKSKYLLTYGAGSNRFSADQGYSEHQLGTAVDLTTKRLGDLSLSFLSTDGGKWLAAHAYEYGFILSYPQGNGYYQYEPWHWRFVGIALATQLHEKGMQFYDLPQREIDRYLEQIFD